jgi:replicative DNA helicase
VVPGGIPSDKVSIIYGESGNFKTTTKNNIVWSIAASGLGTVLDISLEDSDELTTQRFIASKTGVSYGKIATRTLDDNDLSRVSGLRDLEVASRIIMGAEIPPSIDEIVRLARHYKRTRGLVAVVVDYIQLLGYEPEVLTNIMRKAQLSAKRDKIAYIFVSQVKQDVDQRDDHRPKLSDMFGSSAMRIYSKLSVGVYRPWQYEKVPGKKSPYKNLFDNHHDGAIIYSQVMELWLQKNVLGESGVMIPILVDPQTGKMQPMPPEIKAMLA